MMKWSVFVAAAGVVLLLCLLILRPFFGVLAWSAVLATTCYPLYQRLVRRTGRAALSAVITSALMVLAVLVPLVFIGGVAVNQLLAVADSVREALLDPDGLSRRVTAALAPLTQRLGLDADPIVAWANEHASEWIAGAGQYTMSAAAGLGGALLSFALTALARSSCFATATGWSPRFQTFFPSNGRGAKRCSFGSGTSSTRAYTGSRRSRPSRESSAEACSGCSEFQPQPCGAW